ncbi:hypothetical protein [Photobacterium angustum]|uniref:Uncharacterized protein n=1 Tax=Photobacterium angustum TaxID=661 RepID=A0A2S7V9E0_PHOAN|nr:hypothetical protein [Photobacterium angustum]PQJ58495.1 hypothetical protein BTO08_22310 [Photobacterium angustum]
MLKLTTDYTPEVSRQKIYDLFLDTPSLYQIALDLNDTDIIVLAALCDGKSVTNSDYEIGADYSMIRLSAIIGRLRRYFPITAIEVNCLNEIRKHAKRNKYIITKDNFNKLLDDPLVALSECESIALRKKDTREKQDIARFIRRHGEEIAFKHFVKQAYGHKHVTPEQLDKLFGTIDGIISINH